jgi:hypothetical protein
VRAGKSPAAIGKFRNLTRGLVIDCEGGYFAGDATGGAIFDTQGKKIKDIPMTAVRSGWKSCTSPTS